MVDFGLFAASDRGGDGSDRAEPAGKLAAIKLVGDCRDVGGGICW